MEQKNHFLQTIQHLRENEALFLYGKFLHISEQDAQEVAQFLNNAYQEEAWSYPSPVPPFEHKAAI